MIRDHEGIVVDHFNGLWKRGDPDNTPLDHFQDCNNLKFIGTSDFGSRDGIGIYQNLANPLQNALRIYNYPTNDNGNTVLMLVRNGSNGEIYHVINSTTVTSPILTIAGMTDFGFVPYAGRAYITPFVNSVVNGINIQKGMSGEFLYVYLGDGNPARKAAGPTPAGTITPANGAAGHTDAGVHVFGVVGETDTGYLSPPVALANFTTSASLSVSFSTIPTFTGSFWTKRHIVATKVITDFNGNTTGYQLFFIPGATINNNTATTLSNISFYDADLLEDASHLLDNYSEIPAGVGLGLYHNRLILYTTNTDVNLILVSEPGEPEAISQIDGLLDVPRDSNPFTNGQELRDIWYMFRRNKTIAYVDNGDVPSSWKFTIIDSALGAPVHGVTTVLDSGSSNIDYLIIASFRGIHIFNGRYADPELTWKVQDFWLSLDRNEFRKIQILNESIKKQLYCVLPDQTMLIGNYANGLDTKKIRWTPWSSYIKVTCVAVVDIDTVVIGADVQ